MDYDKLARETVDLFYEGFDNHQLPKGGLVAIVAQAIERAWIEGRIDAIAWMKEMLDKRGWPDYRIDQAIRRAALAKEPK